MRTFTDIERDLGLKRFLASQLGTLYFVPFAPEAPRVIVRRFDRDLDPALIGAYVDLVGAAQEWVERRPELERLVRIEQPTEVGADFVARPHHTYYTSTYAYEEWDDPPEPPHELGVMRAALRSALAEPHDDRDRILGRVLARSLLEPTGKTVFDEGEGRFVVVEPKLTREDVESWAGLGDPASRGAA